MDRTLWIAPKRGSGALVGKYAGAFVSTAGPGGGQEVTIQNAISTLTHHGVIFVPLGYAHAFTQITNLTEVHGGTSVLPFHSRLHGYRSFPYS